MPVTRGEEIRITENELELQQRAERLGVELPQNRQAPLPMSIAHVLKYIEESDNDEALKQIARKSTKKLRDKGVISPAKKKKGKLTDRALLHLYLNFSPFILAFAVITPLFVWGTWELVTNLWPLATWLSSDIAISLSQSCPPNCTWYHLGLWAILGGISLLASFLLSYSLRKRLIRAVNPE